MVDYYSILSRAMSAPDAADAGWRRGVYDRARTMLVTQLRARRPPASPAEIAREQSALDAAIERVEAELPQADSGDITGAIPRTMARDGGAPSRLGGALWIIVAVVVAAVGAGGYVYWAAHKSNAPPPPAASAAATPPQQPAPPARAATARKDGDLPPGVDGGSTVGDLSYVYRRQPVFYRTLQPVGTIIVDKLQRFLYLIRPNNVALRYGIGLGEQCSELAGLRHVSSMAEWPPWQPPAGARNPNALPGGPGNPLGARVLQLDDGKSRINGTNAPMTIGNAVAFGCIRLVNDDIVDLYGRVQVSTPVVVN
jgi:lipoprotein-anchoring transpeptidase ErfK/SrfK